jgi:hypothetical protein
MYLSIYLFRKMDRLTDSSGIVEVAKSAIFRAGQHTGDQGKSWTKSKGILLAVLLLPHTRREIFFLKAIN